MHSVAKIKYFFRDPFSYLAIIINLVIAWPVFSLTISLLEDFKGENIGTMLTHSWWNFFLMGYTTSLQLALSVSIGTAFLYTIFFNWLKKKKDSVLERYYIRAVLGGCILSLVNLFPIFLLYQFILGETNIQKLILFTLMGSVLALSVTGPPALVAGGIIGLINGILAHFAISKKNKALRYKS